MPKFSVGANAEWTGIRNNGCPMPGTKTNCTRWELCRRLGMTSPRHAIPRGNGKLRPGSRKKNWLILDLVLQQPGWRTELIWPARP